MTSTHVRRVVRSTPVSRLEPFGRQTAARRLVSAVAGALGATGLVIMQYLLPLLVVVGHQLGGGWHFIVPVIAFMLVPLADHLAGVDTTNPSPEEEATLSRKWLQRGILYGYVPVQLALLVYGGWVVQNHPLSGLELAGLILSIGVATGATGITFAHELGHRTSRIEQALGKALLLMVCYLHFHIEHNLGHHVYVSTPRDPATARPGESFYRFYVRSLAGGFQSAWRIEKRRLERSGRRVLSPRNRMLWYMALPLLLGAGFAGLFGLLGAVFFFGQSLVAFSLLEAINYVEHYGLERRELSPGRYERVTPLHSWNSSHALSNGFLLMLQRHSDHHANPQRRYPVLRHFDESPQLPAGYPGMIVLALVPPLWRRVMDPRVAAVRARIAENGAAGGSVTRTAA